jgi:hypothetical protein
MTARERLADEIRGAILALEDLAAHVETAGYGPGDAERDIEAIEAGDIPSVRMALLTYLGEVAS